MRLIYQIPLFLVAWFVLGLVFVSAHMTWTGEEYNCRDRETYLVAISGWPLLFVILIVDQVDGLFKRKRRNNANHD